MAIIGVGYFCPIVGLGLLLLETKYGEDFYRQLEPNNEIVEKSNVNDNETDKDKD